MGYKHYKDKIVGIRKMKWDKLWHILYTIEEKITWDRVTIEEALSVIKSI